MILRSVSNEIMVLDKIMVLNGNGERDRDGL